MRIYGIKLKKSDGVNDSIKVFYTPMNFIDWKTYNPATIRYDVSAVRYIISTYVKEYLINDEARDINDILNLDVAKQKYIIRGTGFHTDGHTSYEDIIADAFGVEAYDELRLEIHKRLFHIRHVVGRS